MLVELQRSVTTWRLNGGYCCLRSVGPMEIDELGNIDVRDTVSIGHAKSGFALNIRSDAGQPPTRHRLFAGIDERDFPRFCRLLMNMHRIFRHVERNVRHMQEIVSEVFFNDIALVSATNDEIIQAMLRIHFHNVPQDRFAADLDHRFRAKTGFFTYAGSKTTRKNHGFHLISSMPRMPGQGRYCLRPRVLCGQLAGELQPRRLGP